MVVGVPLNQLNNMPTLNLPTILRPSLGSVVGFGLEDYRLPFWEAQRVSCIYSIGTRICCALGCILRSAFDLLFWVGMTITIYPAYLLGKDHFINLISHLVMPILSLSLLFGYLPAKPTFERESVYSLFRCRNRDLLRHTMAKVPVEVAERHLLRNSLTDPEKAAAISTAALWGNKEVVNLLLSRGNVDPNIIDFSASARTPLYSAVAGIVFRTSKDPSTVDTILSYHPSPNIPSRGITPLMLASGSGFNQEVDKLMKAGANPHVRGLDGVTALTTAILGVRMLAEISGHIIVVGTTANQEEQSTTKRSYVQVVAIIHRLIEAEVFCSEKHLDELCGFDTAVNEGNIALRSWLNAEDGTPLNQRNLFRFFLKNTLIRDIRIFQGGAFGWSLEKINLFLNNIRLLTPIVREAKEKVVERRTSAVDACEFFRARPIARIISEYCYS